MEVWAAGVTYRWSRDARVEESSGFSDVYARVYDAPRPELFFKSTAWRVAGHGTPIAIRDDSQVDVPEPELALVVNRYGEVFGYTVCNDVSSRTIEGENPLYLPQAKVFLGGCAVGPAIRPAWEIDDPYNLTIELTILRAGSVVWQGSASTSQLKRRFDELVEYLFRADEFPHGVVLSTGTCLVPDLPFSLQAADVVRIGISEVGVLENPVVRGKHDMLDHVGHP
jgi:2-dehydro-3-deoxy-D-arabinonate dehydratase